MKKEKSEQAIKKELGELIKSKRKQKDLTQEELSEIVGITEMYLRDLEHGNYTATWIICLKICAALDIDLAEIQKKFIVPEINNSLNDTSKKKRSKKRKRNNGLELPA